MYRGGIVLQRLDKILSEAGVASRKDLKNMIRSGRVKVDGRVAVKPEEKFDEVFHPESMV